MRPRTFLTATAVAGVAAAIVTVAQWPSHAAARPDQILMGAGDIASCDLFTKWARGHKDTAKVLGDAIKKNPNIGVFSPGDNSQDYGTADNYKNCFAEQGSWGDPSLGIVERMRPAEGNHDNWTPPGAAYYDYFNNTVPALPNGEKRAGNAGEGYYSYDLGTNWHVVVLNSTLCDPDNKDPKDQSCDGQNDKNKQYQWLVDDLKKSSSRRCTVAYWHHPLFTSGQHAGTEDMRPIYRLLNANGVEVVMNGHNHVYERFAPQDADGKATDSGIRQFGVGTGGTRLDTFKTPYAKNSVIRQDPGKFGVLTLTLHDSDDKPSYEFKYASTDGKFIDQGGNDPLVTACH